MKSISIFGILVLLFSAIALSLPDYADAARMGGGRSFGGGSHMSQPAQRPSMSQSRQATQQTGAAASRGGMLGGMGGVMGGLLAGTLLGSMLSGNGFSGGGFMDIILLGILAFIAYKLFTRFRSRQGQTAAPAAAGYGAHPGFDQQQPQVMNRDNANASGWDNLRNATGASFPASSSNPDIPADFNEEEFMKGAKMVYTKLQEAWDRRDLNEIATFATEPVMKVLREQAAEDPNPSKTEIMMVNATLSGVEDFQDTRRAQVYFDVLMRENPNDPTPENAREIWHFKREGKNGVWKLDGIQQVQ